MQHTETSQTTSTTYLHKSGHYKSRGDVNKIDDQDRPAHDWYRFVLSFPPHVVREYLERFGIDSRHRVLDPFCGAGTTIVECKKLGIPAVGIEANASSRDIFGCSKNRQNRIVENSTYPLDDFGFR